MTNSKEYWEKEAADCKKEMVDIEQRLKRDMEKDWNWKKERDWKKEIADCEQRLERVLKKMLASNIHAVNNPKVFKSAKKMKNYFSRLFSSCLKAMVDLYCATILATKNILELRDVLQGLALINTDKEEKVDFAGHIVPDFAVVEKAARLQAIKFRPELNTSEPVPQGILHILDWINRGLDGKKPPKVKRGKGVLNDQVEKAYKALNYSPTTDAIYLVRWINQNCEPDKYRPTNEDNVRKTDAWEDRHPEKK